jgi:iron complex transport system substrate-binding protein
MKRNVFVGNIAVLVAVLCFFVGCNNNQQQASDIEGELIEIQHKLGVTKVSVNPERIVVLDIGALETLHELGVKPVAVPKKFMPEYLSAIKNDENIADAGSVIEPHLESINALNPDLILISTRQERYFEELSQIAPTVFIGTDNKDYLNSFIENTQLLARITGKEEVADEKLQATRSKIEQAQEKFKNQPEKALFLIYNNGKFSAYGKGSRFGFIHDVLMINPALENMEESVHGQKLSNELIAESNPDFLFIVDRNDVVLGKKASKSEIENKLIQQTAAYKNNRIFYLDPNVWFISGGGLTSVNLMVDDILTILK